MIAVSINHSIKPQNYEAPAIKFCSFNNDLCMRIMPLRALQPRQPQPRLSVSLLWLAFS